MLSQDQCWRAWILFFFSSVHGCQMQVLLFFYIYTRLKAIVYDWEGKRKRLSLKIEGKKEESKHKPKECVLFEIFQKWGFNFFLMHHWCETNIIECEGNIEKLSFISEVPSYARMWMSMWISLWWNLMAISRVWSVAKSTDKQKGFLKFLDPKMCINLDTWWRKA